MRKEQILLVAGVGVGALLIWGATGKYAEVGAKTLDPSPRTDVKMIAAVQPDPTKGLHAEPLKGRSISEQVRPEKRPPLPELPPPPALSIWWVRPIPSPSTERLAYGPTPDHWRPYRHNFVAIKPVEKEGDQPEPTLPPEEPVKDPGNAPVDPQLLPGAKKPFKSEKAAKLVKLTDEESLCILEPSGPFKGQPDWVILEKWPNVQFKVALLNSKTGTPFGSFELTGPAGLELYKTVHLRKTLLNEYHEARIASHVKDDDHDSLDHFATWVIENLPSHSSDDDIPYGVAAIKLAVGDMKAAFKVQNDVATAKKLAEFQHAAYDFEGELGTYVDYFNLHKNDQGVQVLLGDAYGRAGAWATAAGYYEQAAKTGDPEARLKLATVLRRMARIDEATEMLKPLTSNNAVAPRANMELGAIALNAGRFDEAAGYFESARAGGATPALNMALGAAYYGQGASGQTAKFGAADSTFAAAKDDKSSKWRSDRAMAMVATGNLEEAKKEFQACLDTDPVNLVDPLFGLGDAYQHFADTKDQKNVQTSNDFFQTALVRSPDHPWILLRVGAIRLRDNLPEEALAKGRRLLVVAPGCNEGLWLVGRAAEAVARAEDSVKMKAAQALLDAKPADEAEAAALKELVASGTLEAKRTEWFYSLAIAHLRRAREKEKDNRDFLNDFARVLIQSGRLDEAIKTLEEATDVRNGFGRTDGRLLGLLGWAKFLAKRPITEVNEAIQRGRLTKPDPATQEWLDAMKQTIERWDKTRIVEDDFKRPPSTSVGGNWTEQDQQLGIAAGTDGERLIFKAQGAKAAAATRDTATRVWRNDIELNRFNSAETQLKGSAGVESIFHVFVGALTDRGQADNKGRRGGSGFELGLGCDRNGTMVLWMPEQGSKAGVPKEIIVKQADGNPRPWPMDDQFHSIRIWRKDDAKGLFEVWFDDERITLPTDKPEKQLEQFEVSGLASSAGKMLSIGYLVDADAGAPVDVEVESFKVTKINK